MELSRWIGADAIRASLFPKMRDAMKEDIDKAIAALAQLEAARLAALAAAGSGATSTAAPMEIDDEEAGAAAATVDEGAAEVRVREGG